MSLNRSPGLSPAQAEIHFSPFPAMKDYEIWWWYCASHTRHGLWSLPASGPALGSLSLPSRVTPVPRDLVAPWGRSQLGMGLGVAPPPEAGGRSKGMSGLF